MHFLFHQISVNFTQFLERLGPANLVGYHLYVLPYSSTHCTFTAKISRNLPHCVRSVYCSPNVPYTLKYLSPSAIAIDMFNTNYTNIVNNSSLWVHFHCANVNKFYLNFQCAEFMQSKVAKNCVLFISIGMFPVT